MLGELASYFDQYYSIANSLTQMGLSFAIMIIPLLTQLFIDVYGWRGAMLLLAALNMHLILSGAVLRPINGFEDDHRKSSVKTSQHLSDTDTMPFFQKVAFYLDLKLFCDVNFLSMLWYNFGNGYCLVGWFIYLVPYGMDVGFAPYKASALATFGGIGTVIGNSLYPLVTRRLSATKALYISTFVSFISLAANPLFSDVVTTNYIGLSIATVGFGCGRGISVLCVYQIVKEITDEESRTNSIMWINVTYSTGAISTGFLSGECFCIYYSYNIRIDDPFN